MAYVTGVGMLRVDRHYDRGLKELAAEASFKALDESGGDDVDFIVVSSSVSYLQSPQLDLAGHIASAMGFRGYRALSIEAGEASGLASLHAGLSLIRSGSASRVLVVGVDKLTEHPSWVTYGHLARLHSSDAEGFYNISNASIAGILMRLYMERHKVDRHTMAYWPVMMHANAKENPYAMLRFAIRPETVVSAMPLASPLTLLDSYPLGDGAAAVVLESRGSGNSLAYVESVESSTGYYSAALAPDPLTIYSLEEAYRRLQRRARFGSIDVLEIHDSFTIMALLELEALRLAERGRAAEMVAEGYFSVEGEGPTVNPSGGLKARGHPVGATGVYQVAELALQLAGEFPGVKVSGASVGMAVSLNGSGSNAYIALIKQYKEG